MTAPTPYDVGKRLAENDPPQWLVQALEEFAHLIGVPKKDDLDLEIKLFRCAEYIQRWLPLYARLEHYGFDPLPFDVDGVSTNLEELRQFLAKELTHSTSGDPRRKLCAAVCVEGYRLLHDGRVQLHSLNLRQACEDLWRASGNPTTAKAVGADARDNWRRNLEDVAAGDEWVRSRFELYKTSPKII